MKKLVLGLDIGITSVGWGIIDIESNSIINAGVRIFPEGTAANNLLRRTRRGARRVLRRKQLRLVNLKKLLLENKVINHNFKMLSNPYEIRVKGLTEILSGDELATSILNIAKRRGSSFDLIEDDAAKAKDEQSSKLILAKNEKYLNDNNLFICQKLLSKLESGEPIRGHDNVYKTGTYEKELDALLKTQAVSKKLCNELKACIFSKRAYYEGPGSETSPTKYGRYILEKGKIKYVDLIEKMRGKCSIFKEELRASKMSYSADLFNFLNDLNNITINGDHISSEIKKEIVDKLIEDKKRITPIALARFLKVDISQMNGFRINKKEEFLLTEFKGYRMLMDLVNKNSLDKTIYQNKQFVDQIFEILTTKKGIEERVKEIRKINLDVFDKHVSEMIANLNGVTGYHSLSLKAIKIMIPELMESSDNQMQILSRSGLLGINVKNYKGLKKIPFDGNVILSPVAKRAQNETIKVVNSIIKKYGNIDTIVIEMPRDKNSEEQLKREKENQKNGEIINKMIEDLVKGYNVRLNPKLRTKIRLYLNQESKCFYSGNSINLANLINNPEDYEIDHIIPISISFDDSFDNKVLVERDANRLKKNRTPFGYFTSGLSYGWSFEEFKSFAIKLNKDGHIKKKKLHYLIEQRNVNRYDIMKEFVGRNLVDTRFASRVILNTMTDYFKSNDIQTKVHTIRGAVTSMFRKITQIDKNRDESFFHHAVDALIVASLKKLHYFDIISAFNVNNEGVVTCKESGELVEVIDEDKFFSSDVVKFIKNLRSIGTNNSDFKIMVSHKVDKKPNRKFTDDTIYGVRKYDGLNYRMGKYKDIYGPEGIKVAKLISSNSDDKLLIKYNDEKSYDHLKQIVKEYFLDDKCNPFDLYKKDHGFIRKYSKKNNGPIIKSLTYVDKQLGSYLDITHKYIKKSPDPKVVLVNVAPFRTDFYKNEEGLYKFLTVRYVNITTKNDAYYIDDNWYSMQKTMRGIDTNYHFMFSLHTNEIIQVGFFSKKDEYDKVITQDISENQLVEKDSDSSPKLWRFLGTNSDKGNIIEVKHIETQNGDRKKFVIGKKVSFINKYHVDILGNVYKISDEVLHLKL